MYDVVYSIVVRTGARKRADLDARRHDLPWYERPPFGTVPLWVDALSIAAQLAAYYAVANIVLRVYFNIRIPWIFF